MEENEGVTYKKYKSNTYHVFVECTNCGGTDRFLNVDIPKGKEWKKFLYDTNYKCPECGCIHTMERN